MAAFKVPALCLIAVLLAASCSAKDFDVKWGFPATLGFAGGLYPDINANVGDVLTLEWSAGQHGVVSIPSGICPAVFDATTSTVVISPVSGANVTEIPLNKVGEFWYACQVPGHCSGGKMLQKVIVSPATAPAPAPKLAPGAAPNAAAAPTTSMLRGAPANAPMSGSSVTGAR